MTKSVFNPQLYRTGNELEFLLGGEPYFTALLDLINAAQKVLFFQVYIFDEDETGRMVAEALVEAAKRGVSIYMAVDSYGSKDLKRPFVAHLRQHGIHFRFFSPLPKQFYVLKLGRRLHNKAVVADFKDALVGGINVADKYRGTAEEPPWLDFAVRVKGPVSYDLSLLCKRIHGSRYFRKNKKIAEQFEPEHFGEARARLSLNDWWRNKNNINTAYKSAFQQAKESIIIVASYFLPSRAVRRAIKYAARRGVNVIVMVPGESDVKTAKRAVRYLYRWLSRNNIRIFEWGGSILHGKLAVVDQKWVTIGSYNLNHISEYSSIEMNVESLDEDFAAEVRNTLAGLREKCIPVPTDSFIRRNLVNRFLDWLSYVLSRWMMLFLFFLISREYRSKAKIG